MSGEGEKVAVAATEGATEQSTEVPAEMSAEQRLIQDELARKEEELKALAEIAAEAGFKPRQSLARTPPSGFTTPPPMPLIDLSEPANTGKRPLGSPEEVQEAVRRRVASKKVVPPIGGILTSQPRPSTTTQAVHAATPSQPKRAQQHQSGEGSLAGASSIELLDKVHAAVRGISSITNASNKLNMGDKAGVATHSQDILAVVAALQLRLSEAEHQLTATKLQAANAELDFSRRLLEAPVGPSATGPQQPAPGVPSVPSYANALKLPRGMAPIPVTSQGPAVIFYPADEAIRSSEETKKTLQQAVKPGTEGLRIRSVKMVGNSGIVVRTANAAAAQKLKAMVPANLKIAEPKVRQPRVALRYLRSEMTEEELVGNLHQVNLADDPNWPLDKVRSSCKVAVKKQVGAKYLVVLECSMQLRDKLVNLGRVYIGWDEAEVSDHVRATCCNKCQQYGHPEKYCRAKETVCGKCGETGHRAPECQSATACCATCRRFKRKDAHSHSTAAASCPARQYAEAQAVGMLQYG